MLDMKFVRENPDVVKENIKKKFQEFNLPLVDEVIALDAENRAAITEASELRAQRNQLSKQVGMLMGQAKKDPSKLEEAEAAKAQVKANADRLAELEAAEAAALSESADTYQWTNDEYNPHVYDLCDLYRDNGALFHHIFQLIPREDLICFLL